MGTHPRQLPLQGHRGITGLPTRRPVVPRVVPVVCFNMIKSYAHDWLFSFAAYHASSRRWGANAPQRKTRRFTGDREFGVATAAGRHGDERSLPTHGNARPT